MKTLIFGLLFFSLNCFGQDAPKGTNKIIIKDTLTADQNYTLIGRTLAENGYTIESKDKEFGIIKSGPKSALGTRTTYFLTFSIKDNGIVIAGQVNPNLSMQFSGMKIEPSYSPIINRGGGSWGRAFKEMDGFASLLGGDKSYFKD